MSDNDNKVTPTERELAEKVLNNMGYGYISPVQLDHTAHLIHAHNEKQREVLREATIILRGVEVAINESVLPIKRDRITYCVSRMEKLLK